MDKERKEQLIIKICCVIAAFALWLFITGTENPLTAYKIKNIPVKILNTDVLTKDNLVLAPGQDLTTSLNIKGANTSLLLAKKASDFTVVADLGSYALKSGEYKIPIQIKKSPDNVNVVNSDSLFITIRLEEITEKKLPINVNISGNPKSGFSASTPELSTDYATVSGASNLINSVKKIVVDKNIQGVQANISEKYKLKAVDESGDEVKDVVLSPAYTNVEILVKKTKSVGIKVKTTGTLDSKYTLGSIKAIPEALTIAGSSAELNNLDYLNTQDVDLSKIVKSTTMETKVIIPNGLNLVSSTATIKVQVNLNNKSVANTQTTETTTKKVDKTIQKDLSLDIKAINLNANYEATLDSNKISVSVSGVESVINYLDLNKFSAQADLAGLIEGKNSVNVIVSMPKGVTIISQSPNKVGVTTTKKQTEVPTTNDKSK
ncbi:CdaR family protein [Clostridium sp.]|uniref:CdaR family protein n=1 Tax=Clostridium sp. TaxID=1506 RepID=UPI002634BA01|nr:CdaR family protein [uncultured Clostridium sp.]